MKVATNPKKKYAVMAKSVRNAPTKQAIKT